MENKKGNIAVTAIIVVIVAITAGVVGWLLAKKTQAPAQQSTVSVPITQTQSVQPTATQIAIEQQPVTQPNQTDSNASLEDAVFVAVNALTASMGMPGVWDNKIDILAFDSTKTASKGKWFAKDAWYWVAWQQDDGSWKVFAFDDGFECGSDSIIPSRYADFFHDVFYFPLPDGQGEEKVHCFKE